MLFFVGNFGLSSTNEEAHDRFGIVDFLVKPIALELSDHLLLFKWFMRRHDKLNVAVRSFMKEHNHTVIPNNYIQYELNLCLLSSKLTTLGGSNPSHHFLPHIRLQLFCAEVAVPLQLWDHVAGNLGSSASGPFPIGRWRTSRLVSFTCQPSPHD